ncbi:hypothetical protein JAAARDRAFT_209361 [Jaapia argillacea MUCL 33604]|uniref:Uncharacterized protein n=1 Tax=Jaapia argillacea MUCL 33604 TaxID=933084 RepID=A0A067PLI4_9AGAM|nr:hypothetical protein JAAARDRAFT_209361 [Jaapia argillacea MUCL 33604]
MALSVSRDFGPSEGLLTTSRSPSASVVDPSPVSQSNLLTTEFTLTMPKSDHLGLSVSVISGNNHYFKEASVSFNSDDSNLEQAECSITSGTPDACFSIRIESSGKTFQDELYVAIDLDGICHDHFLLSKDEDTFSSLGWQVKKDMVYRFGWVEGSPHPNEKTISERSPSLLCPREVLNWWLTVLGRDVPNGVQEGQGSITVTFYSYASGNWDLEDGLSALNFIQKPSQIRDVSNPQKIYASYGDKTEMPFRTPIFRLESLEPLHKKVGVFTFHYNPRHRRNKQKQLSIVQVRQPRPISGSSKDKFRKRVCDSEEDGDGDESDPNDVDDRHTKRPRTRSRPESHDINRSGYGKDTLLARSLVPAARRERPESSNSGHRRVQHYGSHSREYVSRSSNAMDLDRQIEQATEKAADMAAEMARVAVRFGSAITKKEMLESIRGAGLSRFDEVLHSD